METLESEIADFNALKESELKKKQELEKKINEMTNSLRNKKEGNNFIYFFPKRKMDC